MNDGIKSEFQTIKYTGVANKMDDINAHNMVMTVIDKNKNLEKSEIKHTKENDNHTSILRNFMNNFGGLYKQSSGSENNENKDEPRILEKDQEKMFGTIWQEHQFKNDFRDAPVVCNNDQTRTKMMIKCQDDLLKYSSDEDLMEKEAPVRRVIKSQDDLLKYSSDEDLMEKEAPVKMKRKIIKQSKEPPTKNIPENQEVIREAKIEVKDVTNPEPSRDK